MGARRFGPLIFLLFLGTAVLSARLFQVQVVEHQVWEDEAKNLVRHGAVRPYRRGEFVDAQGRLLVRDEEVYRIDFIYREFRRGHALGQVAHAWASLTRVPVPLDEVWASLEDVAFELVQLTDAELDEFAAGGELPGDYCWVPAEDPEFPEHRSGRRSDVRFYIGQLLQLDRKQKLEAARSDSAGSLLDYAVKVRGFGSRDALLDDLELRLGRMREDLGELARQLELHERKQAGSASDPDRRAPVLQLVERLETWRAKVENETASELFREATRFPAGRVDAQTLLGYLDLDWLALLLRWDAPRTEAWVRNTRADYLSSLEDWSLPRMTIELDLAGAGAPRAATVIEQWSGQYRGEDGLVVFEELDSLFDLRIPRDKRAARLKVLPGWEPGEFADEFEHLAALESWRPPEAPTSEAPSVEASPEALQPLADAWRAYLSPNLDRTQFKERTLLTLGNWEAWFQAALAKQLDTLIQVGEGQPLKIAKGRLDQAEERARSVLKDRGSRPTEVARQPDYDLIYLLGRYPDHFAGFVVRDATERLYLQDERGVTVAGGLLGTVREQGLPEVFGQRDLKQRLEELLHQGTRTAEEEQGLVSLLREVARLDEFKGGDGLEAYYDRELTGHNGYREQRGLQQVVGGEGPDVLIDLEPIDGQQVRLTLDLDLQRAALEALMRSREDPLEEKRDYDWLRHPTGAIVICRPNGDVLAAASFPDQDRESPFPGRRRVAQDLGLERTLRMPSFQPPGSVFKPFVAAWGLEHHGLDPRQTMTCGPLTSGGCCGFDDLHCWSEYGHGELSLHRALKESCNGYFAWLGQQLSQEDFRGLAAEFGFGQPTGVRPDRERGGLYEEYNPTLFERPLVGRHLRTAGNGLAVVQVTPMQLARGYCALATGTLPDMRLVDSVGGEPVARTARPLGLSPAALQIVRGALYDVVNAEGGSAYGALRQSQLGYALCGKTGSADISSVKIMAQDNKMRVRKHTWFAGWFPPEDPVAVVVVFVNDTIQTSSHTSVWVARTLLESPEVLEFIEREVSH